MKVAVLGESAADEAALRILAAGLVNSEIEPVAGPKLRSRGWPSVRSSLPVVMRHVYYRTDADGLIAVVDSDSAVVHAPGQPRPCHAACRACSLRSVADAKSSHLTTVPRRPGLRVAIGLAVPAIEAWYCVGLHPRVTEAAWIQGYATVPPRPPYTKTELKRFAYGVERPALARQAAKAEEHARRLLRDLPRLRQDFPGGFGSFALELEGWRRPTT